jgi:hypothetical protein
VIAPGPVLLCSPKRRWSRDNWDIMISQVAAFEAAVVCNAPDNLVYDFSAKLQHRGEDIPLNGGAGGGQFMQR